MQGHKSSSPQMQAVANQLHLFLPLTSIHCNLIVQVNEFMIMDFLLSIYHPAVLLVLGEWLTKGSAQCFVMDSRLSCITVLCFLISHGKQGCLCCGCLDYPLSWQSENLEFNLRKVASFFLLICNKEAQTRKLLTKEIRLCFPLRDGNLLFASLGMQRFSMWPLPHHP